MEKIGFVLLMIPATIGIIVVGIIMGILFAGFAIYTSFDEDVPDYWKENKNPLGMVKEMYQGWIG